MGLDQIISFTIDFEWFVSNQTKPAIKIHSRLVLFTSSITGHKNVQFVEHKESDRTNCERFDSDAGAQSKRAVKFG